MSFIKLIQKDTDISKLTMREFDWDVEIKGVPYQVVNINGYNHSEGNSLWMYPRDEKPTYENLIGYSCEGCGVCWGIKYEPANYTEYANVSEKIMCLTSDITMITRNGKNFYCCHNGIDEAKWVLHLIQEHPIFFNSYNFEKNLINRKVWWRGELAIITEWIGNGQASVTIEPDGMESFKVEPMKHERAKKIRTNIFDQHIYWYRD